jgi:hypothetical protein
MTPALTVEHADELAGDLIRALAEHIGDLEAIDALMLRWADTLGASNLARVSLAAAPNRVRRLPHLPNTRRLAC